MMLSKIWVPDPKQIEQERRWIDKEVKRIGEKKLKVLIKLALKYQKNAYAPYSKYFVGGSVLAKGGEMFGSCNIEVASYAITDCAESSAVTKAVSEGMVKKHGRRFIKAVVDVTDNFGSPCGRCRQKIIEYCDNCLIIMVNDKGRIGKITSMKILLADAFTPTSLGIK